MLLRLFQNFHLSTYNHQFWQVNWTSSNQENTVLLLHLRQRKLWGMIWALLLEFWNTKLRLAEKRWVWPQVLYSSCKVQGANYLLLGMLETVKLETNILGAIKNANNSNFRLPDDPIWPVIMICAGSGIAPFRGFWMRRFQQCQEGQVVGKTIMYFGCRKKSMNLLKNETEMLAKANRG